MTKILAFDTSGPWCAVALLRGDDVLTRVEDMARGQGERLMALVQEVVTDAGLTFADLTAIGTGTGPGNFTGIRISVAAARGLAMGLNIPAIGIDGFEARAACHPADTLVGIPAPRDHIYVADPDPRLIPTTEAPQAQTETNTADLVAAIARLTAPRAAPDAPPPAPLYVKPADAAPSRETGPVMLD